MTGLAKLNTFSLNLLVYFFVAVLSAQIAGVPICRAADTAGGNFMFILDASGSMAGKIQGKPKIDVAKEVLSNLINDQRGVGCLWASAERRLQRCGRIGTHRTGQQDLVDQSNLWAPS